MSQAALGLGLVRSGAILLTTSFIWGTQVANTPYPRIALSTHLNMLQHGLLSIAAGLVMREHGLVGKMDDWQVWVVFIPHMYLWVLGIVNICNTFWGTNKFLTILAKESDAPGGKTWQEVIVKCVSIGAGLLIPAWGVLSYKLFS